MNAGGSNPSRAKQYFAAGRRSPYFVSMIPVLPDQREALIDCHFQAGNRQRDDPENHENQANKRHIACSMRVVINQCHVYLPNASSAARSGHAAPVWRAALQKSGGSHAQNARCLVGQKNGGFRCSAAMQTG
jgi:hypothetical protein